MLAGQGMWAFQKKITKIRGALTLHSGKIQPAAPPRQCRAFPLWQQELCVGILVLAPPYAMALISFHEESGTAEGL